MSTPITPPSSRGDTRRLEDLDAIFRQDAETDEWFDAEYDEWLAAWTSDAYEAWLDDVVEEADELVTEWAADDYIPFQLDASHYADRHGTLCDAPGYAESVTPFCF